MKSGRSRKSQIPQLGQSKVRSVDDYLNDYFERIDEAQAREEAFFKTYFKWFEDQREARNRELSDALSEAANRTVEGTYYRIIDMKYVGDPLCVYGSTLQSGQRFNIGQSISHYKPFHALYVASNDETAYIEKFHYARSFTRGNLTSAEFNLRKNYACFEVEVSMNNCIDISDKNSLKAFCEVISQIKPTAELLSFARSIGIPNLKTIQTPGELLKNLLIPEFLKYPTALEMPSNPQWFGFYCMRAGIQGIIYPSVRSNRGTNVAILVDNLLDTNSFAKLNADTPAVPESRRELRSENLHFFKIPDLQTRPH